MAMVTLCLPTIFSLPLEGRQSIKSNNKLHKRKKQTFMANKALPIHDQAIGAAATIMFRYGIEHQHNPAIEQPNNDHNDQQQTQHSNTVRRA